MKRSLSFLGIDVGFSQKHASTGLAWQTSKEIRAATANADRESRLACLPIGFRANFAAIDGPLVPKDIFPPIFRYSERCLARGVFSRRCKPGFSNWGHGLALRRAAWETAMQIKEIVGPMPTALERFAVIPGCAIVEAFPNAFLGVMLSDKVYARQPHLKRGQRFDWLYEEAKNAGVVKMLLKHLGDADDTLVRAISEERNHEKCAAYVCLLTALCAASGIAKMVGDKEGGWICLPPVSLWAGWASDALARSERDLALT